MFGLMRGRGEERRRHYCGTCKTIGQSYGHTARFLLNHDTVFLAELLTALTQDNSRAWDAAYQRRNCLARPAELPIALQFSAAATVMLADAKLADHAEDSPRPWWNWARRILSPRSRRAAQALAGWGLPVDEVRRTLAGQKAREQQPLMGLPGWAEPTAHVTGLFFRYGATTVGRSDLAASMYRTGRRFGELIYVLDAWEDYDRDRTRGEFNALHAAYGERRRAAVEEAAQHAARELRALGCESFAARLQSNVAARIGLALPVVCSCAGPRPAALPSGGAILMGEPKLPTVKKHWYERCGCESCNGCDSDCCDGCCDALSCCECCGSCDASCCECGGCCECGDCSCDCN